MKAFLEKIFPSLGKKIAATVIVVLLISGGAFAIVALDTGRTILKEQTLSKAHGISVLLRNVLERLMLDEHSQETGKILQIQNALETATRSPDIVGAYILDTNGTVLVHATGQHDSLSFSINEFREYPEISSAKFMEVKDGKSHFEYVLTPIEKKAVCNTCHSGSESLLGYFALKISTDEIWSTARKHRNTNIMLTIVIFGSFGIIIFTMLTVLVIKPVGRLHGHVRHIGSKLNILKSGEKTNFGLLPDPKSKDEIADLTRDFNNLVRNLNEANAKLVEMHQKELEQADRLATAGEMAASIAHEIKNPLTGILGAVQVFDSELQDNDARKEILAEMMVQLERINHAINDLLSYARPAPPVFEKIDLHGLIQKTLALLPHQFTEKHITINTDIAENPMMISGDGKLLQQVLWNIILNGLQAMETGGVLSLATREEKAFVIIRIKDSGKGIPSDQLDRVFKPFYTTKHKGTGLGMTISKSIIEQHHGSIRIESRIGIGTTVEIYLPTTDI